MKLLPSGYEKSVNAAHPYLDSRFSSSMFVQQNKKRLKKEKFLKVFRTQLSGAQHMSSSINMFEVFSRTLLSDNSLTF